MGLGRILLRLILVRRWPIDTLARNEIDEHAVLRGSKRARADQVPDLVGIVRRNVVAGFDLSDGGSCQHQGEQPSRENHCDSQ